ncbi:MAG: hypothetical protein FD163_2556 [Hyphomonadaceae bacterium]|nr:MAG: hypothetical protein FD163_2556 [Hyphomonadaceae bacterium]
MHKLTAAVLQAYVSHIALMNNIEDTKSKFTVEPSVQQALFDVVQENSGFLKLINIVPVEELSGDLLGLSVGGTIAGRTNTGAGTERTTRDPSSLDGRTYTCKKTDFDTHITYAKLDMWAKFADFQTRVQNLIAGAMALDLIRIGFNGTSAAVTTDRTANPLLQDVNIGWLQKLRTEPQAAVPAKVRVMTGGVVVDEVSFGTHATADYKNLDALVFDAKRALLPSHSRDDTGLVAIVSSGLLDDKYFDLINKNQPATETVATDILMSTRRLGGLQAYQVPFMPDDTILITKFDNLSIYEQSGKRRRTIIDNPKLDQLEDYQSANQAFVIEDLDYACMIENIVQKDAA